MDRPAEKLVAIPTLLECESLWDEYATPKHVREHMRQVARVARYLAEGLQLAGEHVMIDLVERAAYLHDTLRVTDWDELRFDWFPDKPTAEEVAIWQEQRRKYPQNIPHAQVNHDLFVKRYPEMARLILLHSTGDVLRLVSWEEKIVNYADRRVAHSKIVTVAERLDESYQRYKQGNKRALERDTQIVSAIYAIEEEIFSHIGGDPDRLPL